MAFGSILHNVGEILLTTADGITTNIKPDIVHKIGIKIFGIPHMGLRIRSQKVMKMLSPGKDDIVLDAGCGIGLYLLSMARLIKHGFGVDIESSKITTAIKIINTRNLRNLDFQVTNLYNLPFPNEFFNKALCTEVVEHIEDDERVFSELYRVLKKGGILVLTTPSSTCKLTIEMQKKYEHVRSGYTLVNLKGLIEGTGFTVQEANSYGLFFGQIAWKLNRKCFSSKILTALTFYPLFLFAMLDKFIFKKEPCFGYIMKVKKN